MRVLGRVTSINVRKVLWALDEMGFAYEREDWGLPLVDPNVPEFLSRNPNGQVPVLIDGDFSMWESNAILVYLTEKDVSGALLPDDVRSRGLVLQWLGWQATELNPPWGYAVNALLRRNPDYSDRAQIDASVARWTRKMEILEAALAKGQGFIVGAGFSIADIALGLSCHRWFMTPFDKPVMPATEDYYERLRAKPAGAQWMPDDYG